MKIHLYGLASAWENDTLFVELTSNDGKHSVDCPMTVEAALTLKDALNPDHRKDRRGYTLRDYVEAAQVGVDL